MKRAQITRKVVLEADLRITALAIGAAVPTSP